MSIVIYTSSTGGNQVQKNFTSMQSLVKIVGKVEAQVKYIDIEPEARKFAEEKSGRKGEWPLLFNGDKFIGNFEEVGFLNEDGELAAELK